MRIGLYIPCFNAENYIGDVLKGVFKQSLLPDKVIVIDDSSTDKTAQTASSFPVKVIRHKKNKGLAAARNTAIRNINTEFIASLDADCVPGPGWLEKLMKRLDSPEIAGTGGRLLEMHSSTVFDFWRSVHMKQYWEKEATAPPFLFGSNTLFRRQALVKVGLYNEGFKNNYEDVDICRRLKKKGYLLTYESKAIVHHLRHDNIYSILNNYWRWNSAYYQKKEFYSNPKSFSRKLKDNIGLANRYIEEDIASKRFPLLYLDFLLVLHHSLKDFEYFTFQGEQEYLNYSLLSLWLSLLDLTFFYHFDSGKNSFSTLIPKQDTFLQNFFVLNLILGRFIQERFKNKKLEKILYRHLLTSIYGIDDTYLLNKLLDLIELHPDWSQFCKKMHPNLDTLFLKDFYSNFQNWLDSLMFNFPKIIQMIEVSAQNTDINREGEV